MLKGTKIELEVTSRALKLSSALVAAAVVAMKSSATTTPSTNARKETE